MQCLHSLETLRCELSVVLYWRKVLSITFNTSFDTLPFSFDDTSSDPNSIKPKINKVTDMTTILGSRWQSVWQCFGSSNQIVNDFQPFPGGPSPNKTHKQCGYSTGSIWGDFKNGQPPVRFRQDVTEVFTRAEIVLTPNTLRTFWYYLKRGSFMTKHKSEFVRFHPVPQLSPFLFFCPGRSIVYSTTTNT